MDVVNNIPLEVYIFTNNITVLGHFNHVVYFLT